MADAVREKKPNIFVRMWRRIKEVASELKKVSWPTWGKTLRQTGIVLAVVIFFLVFIVAFDSLLNYLFRLLTEQTAGISPLNLL